MQKLVLAIMLMAVNAYAQTPSFKIGVHYFPGWKDNQIGAAYALPWEKIKPYPEREPLLGWYPDGELSIMNQHLAWMKEYGIGYVVFNWFWSRDGKPVLTHALNAYLQSSDKHGIQFSILWANHTSYIFSRAQFEAMFRFWAQRYMFRGDYLTIGGKPVVFILSADIFNKNAAKINMKTSELIALADETFKQEGLSGVQFIGDVGGRQRDFDYSQSSGYAGFSVYNYYGPATIRFANGRQNAHNYEEWDLGYRDQWKWFLENSAGYYILPMSVGWDKRPWGGSRDPGQDNSISTPEQFERHLLAGKALMSAYPEKTQRTSVICCWNEFGEGSFVEPTKLHKFEYLDKIRKVFGAP
jgi:hypothetical protein